MLDEKDTKSSHDFDEECPLKSFAKTATAAGSVDPSSNGSTQRDADETKSSALPSNDAATTTAAGAPIASDNDQGKQDAGVATSASTAPDAAPSPSSSGSTSLSSMQSNGHPSSDPTSSASGLKILDVSPPAQAMGEHVFIVLSIPPDLRSAELTWQLQVLQDGTTWQSAVDEPCDFPLGSPCVVRAKLRSWPPLVGAGKIRLKALWRRDDLTSQCVRYQFALSTKAQRIHVDSDVATEPNLSSNPSSTTSSPASQGENGSLICGQTQTEFQWLCRQIPDEVFKSPSTKRGQTSTPLRADIVRRLLERKSRGLLAVAEPNGDCRFQKDDCVLISCPGEAKSAVRMEIANFVSKCMPHALAYKLFRDPTFPLEEWQSLRKHPLCMYGYLGPAKGRGWQSSKAVCINPFHYEILGKLSEMSAAPSAASNSDSGVQVNDEESSANGISGPTGNAAAEQDSSSASETKSASPSSQASERANPRLQQGPASKQGDVMNPLYSPAEVRFLCQSVAVGAITGIDPKRAAPKAADLVKRLLDKAVVGKFCGVAADASPAFQCSDCILVSCAKSRSAVRMDVANFAAKCWPQALAFKLFRVPTFQLEEWQTLRKISSCKYGYMGPKHGTLSGWPDSTHICINPFHYQMFGCDDPRDIVRVMASSENRVPDPSFFHSQSAQAKSDSRSSSSTKRPGSPTEGDSKRIKAKLSPSISSSMVTQAVAATWNALQALHAVPVQAAPGSFLFAVGQLIPPMIIVSGTVELITPLGQVVEVVEQGGVVGVFGRGTGTVQPVAARAQTPVSYLVVRDQDVALLGPVATPFVAALRQVAMARQARISGPSSVAVPAPVTTANASLLSTTFAGPFGGPVMGPMSSAMPPFGQSHTAAPAALNMMPSAVMRPPLPPAQYPSMAGPAPFVAATVPRTMPSGPFATGPQAAAYPFMPNAATTMFQQGHAPPAT